MSGRDLTRVHNRLAQTIKVNFANPIAIDAIVTSISTDKKYFTISTADNKHMLDCYTEQNISELKENDRIRLKATLRLHPNNTGKMYLWVEYFYTVDQTAIYTENLEMYSKLKNILSKENFQVIVQKHYQKPIPTRAYNIGLIVFQDDEANIENFKKMFQEKCVGELFIRHLSGAVENDLCCALNYFSKYHYIDLICILSNKVSMPAIFQLSSKDNVKRLLGRKKIPYLVSIINNTVDMKPLSAVLSNKTFGSVEDCINFIQNIQTGFKQLLSDNINSGVKQLELILAKHRERLLEQKLFIAELNDPRFPQKVDITNPFEQLKAAIVKRLIKERLLLGNIKTLVMRKLIEDPTVKKIYTDLIALKNKTDATEQKKIENKLSENSLNDKLSINIQRQNGEF